MEEHFTRLLDSARAAVTVKDSGGYCVHANRREEALKGVGPGGLLGKHITEMVDADPVLVQREFDRFKLQRAWVGQYPSHDFSGQPLKMRTYNFIHREWDGTLLYASFAYILAAYQTVARDGPLRIQQSSMTFDDVYTAQLCVDGYSDEEIGVLLGIPLDAVHTLVECLVDHIGARSRTEACVLALKARLVV
jgi:PAS domain-containing protein